LATAGDSFASAHFIRVYLLAAVVQSGTGLGKVDPTVWEISFGGRIQAFFQAFLWLAAMPTSTSLALGWEHINGVFSGGVGMRPRWAGDNEIEDELSGGELAPQQATPTA